MADAPNEPTPDVPETDPANLDADLAEVLAGGPDDVLADLSEVDALVGDASSVLEGLETDVPELEEFAEERKATPAPDLSSWSKPRYAAERIDVSKEAGNSSATPAERIALVVLPLMVIAIFVALAFVLL